MTKFGLAAAAAGLVVASVVACSSSSSGNSAFPFSGPNCNGGPPGTQQVSADCTSCVDNACSSQFSCIKTDCADYYNCLCACQPNDTTCESKCTQSSACMTCNSGAGQCLISANGGSCASKCGASGSSSGGTSSGATSSGGTSSGGGGTPTGTCAQVMTCCATLPSSAQSSCDTIAGFNDQNACSAFLSGVQDAGLCH